MTNKLVPCTLTFELNINCPECDNLIDMMNENETNGDCHNDDNYLVDQVFNNDAKWNDFECEEVICSQCKAEFNVKGLDW